MRQAAEQLNFELAARLRDQLGSVRKAMERQQMVSSTPEDFDIAAFAEDDLEAAVQVFFVRRGRVVGRRGFVVDKVEALDTAALAATFVQQLYGDRGDEAPREVFLPVLPDGADALRAWLAGLRGGPVDFRVPRRGEKRALLETVAANAREAFATHKLKRASDFDARARGLKELQEALDLPEAPLRIECYDISNLQGSQVVGSMVVFEDGLARKSEYRRFEVRSVEGQDDVASLRGGPVPPPGPPGHRTRPAGGAGGVRGTPRGCPGRSGWAPQEVRLPAEPDRGRRGPAPAGRRPRGGAGLGQPRPAGGLAGQADGGGLPAGHGRPGGHPPDQRGPVPAAAGPRRGPPVRHHLPPQAARPVDDPQRARRHPRGGGDPPPPAGAPFRVGPQGRPGQPGGAGAGSRRRPPAC